MKTLIPFLVFCVVATCNAEPRTWTAVNGKEVEAEFVSNEKGIVKLKLKSGKVFEVPAHKLSKDDNDFISSLVKPEEVTSKVDGVNLKELDVRKNIIFLKGSETPYTGKIFLLHENGQKAKEGNIKEGKEDGVHMTWFEDGQKQGEANFTSGHITKMVSWHKNGQKAEEVNFKDSSPDGLMIEWHENGQKKRERAYEVGFIVKGSEKLWNSQGETVDSIIDAVLVNRDVFIHGFKNDGVTISSCSKKASGKLVVPATIENKPVTSIGKGAFDSCDSVTSIKIPDSVISIGTEAFLNCQKLANINIPDGITSIGSYTFCDCAELTKIIIPDSIKIIGSHAFKRCYGMTSVTFLGDAPMLGEFAFEETSPIIYRNPEAKGWGDTFGGRPVKLISDKPVAEAKPELEGVNYKELEFSKGIAFLKGSDTPYTGKSVSLYANGQKETKGNFKDGKHEGLQTFWYANGQKEAEGNYKDGKLVGSRKYWNLKGEPVDFRGHKLKLKNNP